MHPGKWNHNPALLKILMPTMRYRSNKELLDFKSLDSEEGSEEGSPIVKD